MKFLYLVVASIVSHALAYTETHNIVEDNIPYYRNSNSYEFQEGSHVLLVIDDRLNNETMQVNYDAYNRMLKSLTQLNVNQTLNSRNWEEQVETTWIAIQNLYGFARRVTDYTEAAMHHVVTNTDWINTVVNRATAWAISNHGISHGDTNSCQSFSFDHESWGYDYHLGMYMDTKGGMDCKFAEQDANNIMQVLIDAFNTNAQEHCTGRCFTLFNYGSSVAYLKYVRKDGGMHISDVKCATINGYPQP